MPVLEGVFHPVQISGSLPDPLTVAEGAIVYVTANSKLYLRTTYGWEPAPSESILQSGLPEPPVQIHGVKIEAGTIDAAKIHAGSISIPSWLMDWSVGGDLFTGDQYIGQVTDVKVTVAPKPANPDPDILAVWGHKIDYVTQVCGLCGKTATDIVNEGSSFRCTPPVFGDEAAAEEMDALPVLEDVVLSGRNI